MDDNQTLSADAVSQIEALQKQLAQTELDKQEAEDALLDLSQHLTWQEEKLEKLQNNTSQYNVAENVDLKTKLHEAELESEHLSEQLLAKDLSMSQLMTEISDLKDSIEALQVGASKIEQLQDTEEQLTHLNNKLAEIQQENSDTSLHNQSEISRLQNELSQTQQQLSNTEQLLNDKEAQLAKYELLESENQQLIVQLNAFKGDIERSATESTDLKNLNDSLTNKVEHVENQLEEKAQGLIEFKLKFEGAESANSELNNRLKTKDVEIHSLQKRNEGLGFDCDELRIALSSATSKIAHVESESDLQKQSLTTIEKKLRLDVEELEQQLARVNSDFNAQTEAHQLETSELNLKLQEQIEHYESALQEQHKLGELLEVSRMEKRAAVERVKDLETQLSALHTQHINETTRLELTLKEMGEEHSVQETQWQQTLLNAEESITLIQDEIALSASTHNDAITNKNVEIQQLNEQLQNAKSSQSEQVRMLERERDENLNKLTEIESALASELEQHLLFQSQASTLQDSLDALTLEFDQYKASSAQQLAELEADKTTQLNVLTESNAQQLAELEAEKAKQLNALTESNALQFAELEAEKAKQLNALTESNEQQLAELEAKFTNTKNELEVAFESEQHIQQELADALKATEKHQQEMVNLRAKLADQRSSSDKLDSAESSIQQLRSELALSMQDNIELKEQVNYAEQKSLSLQEQLGVAQQEGLEQNEQLYITNRELTQRLEDIQLQTSSFRVEYEQMKIKVQETSEQLNSVDDDLVACQKTLHVTQNDLRQLRDEYATLEYEHKLISSREEQLRDELEGIKQGKIEETELVAEAEVDHARTVIQQLRSENARLKVDLDEKISDLESQVTEYRLKFKFAQKQLEEQTLQK